MSLAVAPLRARPARPAHGTELSRLTRVVSEASMLEAASQVLAACLCRRRSVAAKRGARMRGLVTQMRNVLRRRPSAWTTRAWPSIPLESALQARASGRSRRFNVRPVARTVAAYHRPPKSSGCGGEGNTRGTARRSPAFARGRRHHLVCARAGLRLAAGRPGARLEHVRKERGISPARRVHYGRASSKYPCERTRRSIDGKLEDRTERC
jgi:hypothetical protein